MTIMPPAVDYLKFCAAEAKSQLDYVIDRLGQVDADYPLTEDETEVLQTFLEGVQRTVIEATAMFCRDNRDFETYTDGRPVRTQLEIEEGVIFEYRWHPQRDHRDNLPHVIYTARGRDGNRRTVLVSAPYVLDTVDHGRGLHIVNSGSAL
ncbi:hypothetical protein A5735_04860 [Mycolicibacter heraklionensis]|nr:hypothetical protein A5735_04860 [Mycolicibacter heraklionensis]